MWGAGFHPRLPACGPARRPQLALQPNEITFHKFPKPNRRRPRVKPPPDAQPIHGEVTSRFRVGRLCTAVHVAGVLGDRVSRSARVGGAGSQVDCS
jgi:hypothetical protein